MAAPPKPRYASQVVIDSSNKVIRASDGLGPYDATLVEGTYFLTGDNTGDNDLAGAIIAALEGAGAGNDWNVFYLVTEKMRFVNEDATWSIDWDHANTTFDGSLLGIADLSAAFGAADANEVTADYLPKRTWIGGQAVLSDSGIDAQQPEENGARQSRAASGQIYTVKTGGPYKTRTIGHAWESKAKTWPAATADNSSFQEFHRTASGGERVRYWPDSTNVSIYFDAVLEESSCNAFRPARLQPGIELWSWDVVLLGYET